MLKSLYERYGAWDDPEEEGLLLHGTSNYPQGTNIDVPLIYGDFYFCRRVGSAERVRPVLLGVKEGADEMAFMHPISRNPLNTKEDLREALRQLTDPLRDFYSEGGARLQIRGAAPVMRRILPIWRAFPGFYGGWFLIWRAELKLRIFGKSA
ncbi:hypothetical protein HMSSN036_96170 [Paenibacillus macerans]|nr:hypothetical protein HMSSN036_96170 [Paenibacillus macerans]